MDLYSFFLFFWIRQLTDRALKRIPVTLLDIKAPRQTPSNQPLGYQDLYVFFARAPFGPGGLVAECIEP